MRAPSTWSRVMFLSIGFIALLNPTVIRQERTYLSDVVAVLVDESLSQSATGRLAQVGSVSEGLQQSLLEEDDLDVRLSIIRDLDREDGTFIAGALSEMFSDVPTDRIAGAFVITDGQIHDDPSDFMQIDYPVNFLLTGDPEKNEYTTNGENGELWASGPNVMRGYLNDPEETDKALVKYEGNLWYKTGDLFSMDSQGFLTFRGRIGRQFKLRNGEFVNPEMLERIFSRAPLVEHILVYGGKR